METVTTAVTNTVTNVASVASRAIWGDGVDEEKKDSTTDVKGGEEPLSGEMGDVKSGEPYDKGNLEDTKPSTTITDKDLDKPSTKLGSGQETTLPAHTKITDTNPSSDPAPLDTAPIVQTLADAPAPAPAPAAAAASTSTTTSDPKPIDTAPIAKSPTEAPAQSGIQSTETKKTEQAKSDTSAAGLGVVEKAKEFSASGNTSAGGGKKESVSKDSGAGDTHVERQGVVSDGKGFDSVNPGESKSGDHPVLGEKGASNLTAIPKADNKSSSTETKKMEASGSTSSPPFKEKKSLGEKIGLEKIKAKLHHKHKD